MTNEWPVYEAGSPQPSGYSDDGWEPAVGPESSGPDPALVDPHQASAPNEAVASTSTVRSLSVRVGVALALLVVAIGGVVAWLSASTHQLAVIVPVAEAVAAPASLAAESDQPAVDVDQRWLDLAAAQSSSGAFGRALDALTHVNDSTRRDEGLVTLSTEASDGGAHSLAMDALKQVEDDDARISALADLAEHATAAGAYSQAKDALCLIEPGSC